MTHIPSPERLACEVMTGHKGRAPNYWESCRKATCCRSIAILLLFIANCNWVVNQFAFFPEREQPVVLNDPDRGMREIYIRTDDEQLLQCVLLIDSSSSKLVIYYHGNGDNVSQHVQVLSAIRKIGVSVFAVDYRGFGRSSGRPSEKGIYRDGAAAYRYAVDSLQYQPDRIFLCGRSIGTTVALATSIQYKVAGLVMITPLTTGRQFAEFHGMGPLRIFAANSFNVVEKCRFVTCPVLIIHGTADRALPYSMGKRIYQEIGSSKSLKTIAGGNHHNLEYVDSTAYWSAFSMFVNGRE